MSRYRIALAAVGLPLLVYILGCIISMVQRHSVFEVAGWRDTGFVGAIKRYRMRQEDKKKQAFATRIFRQNENLDVQYVDIDGQRYYRDHRSRRYKVRLGDRAADYYNPRGDDVPVYDGKRQTRKKADESIKSILLERRTRYGRDYCCNRPGGRYWHYYH